MTLDRFGLVACLSIGSSAWTSAALAQTQPSAPVPAPSAAHPAPRAALADAQTADLRRDVDAARRLFAEHDYGGAYLRLSRAYDAFRDPELLVEMAACDKAMQHDAAAMTLLDRALVEGPAGAGALTPTQLASARDLRTSIVPQVGRVKFSVDPPGATVQVDDATVGTSPLAAPIWLDVGSRAVRVTKPGFRDGTTTMTIYGTSERALEMKLEPDAPMGRIRIETAAKNVVVVDGIVGYGNWDGRVSASASHTVQITAPNMNPFVADVRVPANMSRTFDVKLEPDRDAPVWLWVVGGAVLAGAAVLAAVVVFHSDSAGSVPVASGSSGLQIKWP